MAFFRGTVTFELWFSASDQQEAEERIDRIMTAVERQCPEINATEGARDIEEIQPDFAEMRAGV